MARCGIAIYGLDPFGEDPVARGLDPALSLRSYVADVKEVRAGDTVGYGRTWSAPSARAWRCCRSATATATGAGCPTRPRS